MDLQIQKTSAWQLNLAKGFKYENQDVSSYDSPKLSTAELDKEVENNLNVKLPTWKLDEAAEADFVSSLDEDWLITVGNLISQWYSYNAAKTLYENKDKYQDITAEWIAKYQRKPYEAPWWVEPAVWTATIGWWTLLGAGATNKYVWKWLEKWWEWLYGQTYDSSIWEERYAQKLGSEKRTNEYFINKARQKVEEAKKSWQWIKEAEEELAKLEAKWKTLPWREWARTMRDTAFENRLWWWLTKNRTASARWEEARSTSEILWKEKVEKTLKDSKQTVNVQKLVDSLEKDIEEMAKLDPDRAAELKKARESLKKSYADEKYANLALSDAETLKSWLQWRTPQKFFKETKFQNESDITEAVSELRWVLSKKLRQEVLTKLEEEWLEDAATVMRDYSNLIEIADREAQLATKWWLKWWAWKFVSTVYEWTAQPTFRKIGLWLNKAWTKMQKSIPAKVWDWMADNWKKVVNTVKWKMSVKNLAKSMRTWVFDPIWMIELWELLPWTLWELFKEAAQIPAVRADEMMYEIQSYKDAWNSMSDDERIMQIMDEYNAQSDNPITEEDARATYEYWLKSHPSWELDEVNSIEVLRSA